MNNLPQMVTERYVSNLLNGGDNGHFILHKVFSQPTRASDNTLLGYHYEVLVEKPGIDTTNTGFGATPSQALRNALIKFGVTFR